MVAIACRPDSQSAMTDELRLYAFNCGWFQCRPGYFVEGDEGDYLRGPVPSYLIDHPTGRALFDTPSVGRGRG